MIASESKLQCESNKCVDINHPPFNPLPSREGICLRFPLPLWERVKGEGYVKLFITVTIKSYVVHDL